MNKIFIFLGPSGSGKTTLAELISVNHPHLFHKVTTATTREARTGEVHGKDYYFLDQESFSKMKMAESEFFAGNNYGTPASELEVLKNILLVVEPKGAASIKKYVEEHYKNKEVIVVYFNISEEVRRGNMVKRGDNFEKVVARLKADNINDLITDLKIPVDIEFKLLEAISESPILELIKGNT